MASIIKFGTRCDEHAGGARRAAHAEGEAVKFLHQRAKGDKDLVGREPKAAVVFEIAEVKRDVIGTEPGADRRIGQVTAIASQVRNRLLDLLPALPHDLLLATDVCPPPTVDGPIRT